MIYPTRDHFAIFASHSDFNDEILYVSLKYK